jgi:hypothetical protein
VLVGIWKNYRLYAMTAKQYRELYYEGKISNNDGYVITDHSNYIVVGKKVVGRTLNKHRSVSTVSIDQVNWNDVVGIKVITKRPTVEAVNKNSVKVNELAAEGEVKFNAIVAEAQEKTAEVRRKRRPVKKTETEIE